jgi:hypothetical protein
MVAGRKHFKITAGAIKFIDLVSPGAAQKSRNLTVQPQYQLYLPLITALCLSQNCSCYFFQPFLS